MKLHLRVNATKMVFDRFWEGQTQIFFPTRRCYMPEKEIFFRVGQNKFGAGPQVARCPCYSDVKSGCASGC